MVENGEKGLNLTQEQCRAARWLAVGTSQSATAKHLHVNQSTVSRWVAQNPDFRALVAHYRDSVEEESEKKKLQGELAAEDFREFCPFVLRTDRGDPIQPAAHQKDIIEALQDIGEHPEEGRKLIIIAPRGAGKTYLVGIGFLAWMIGRNHTRHHGLLSFSDRVAWGRSAAIRNLVSLSEDYRCAFPEVEPDKKAWDKAEWKLKRPNVADPHPTLRAGGTMSAVVSYRLDGLLIDDAMDDKNSATAALREKTFENYEQAISPCLVPEAWQVCIGCLTADSPVLMADGSWKAIVDVKPGEQVWAVGVNGRRKVGRVSAMIPQGEDDVFLVQTDRNSIRGNARHPFLVFNGHELEWRRLKDLAVGDVVVTAKEFNSRQVVDLDSAWLAGMLLAGEWRLQRIRSITPAGREEVYDLSVDGTESFIADGFVVHNTRWSDDDFIGRLIKKDGTDPSKGGWRVIFIKALDEKGNSYWPEVYPNKFLKEKRYKSPAIFAVQYQGDTTAGEAGIIKRLGRYDKDPLDLLNPDHDDYRDLLIAVGADSVAEFEPVTVRIDGYPKVMRFDVLWDSIKVSARVISGREVKDVDNLEVLEKHNWVKVSCISRHCYSGILKDVRTRSGRVRVTPNHSLIDCTDKEIRPQDLEYRYNLPVPPWKRIPHTNRSVRGGLDAVRPTARRSGRRHLPAKLFVGSLELAWVLGLFVAEGSVSQNKGGKWITQIANYDATIRQRAANALKDNLRLEISNYWNKIQVGGSPTAEFFMMCYESGKPRSSEFKIIPSIIENAEDDVRKAFFDGYMAGDGFYDKKTGMPKICTKSSVLAQQLTMLVNEIFGLKPKFYWRDDKPKIVSVTFNRKSGDTLANKVRDEEYSGYVYDLTTESHRFRAGVGGILLHNTAYGQQQRNDYCVGPNVRVLTNTFEWIPASQLRVGDGVIGFDEHIRETGTRHFQPTHVIRTRMESRPTYTITLTTGEQIVTTPEHQWLMRNSTNRLLRWIRTDELPPLLSRKRTLPLCLTRFVPLSPAKKSYRAGFLAAAFDAEGWVHRKAAGLALYFSQCDNVLLHQVEEFLAAEGYRFRRSYGKNGVVQLSVLGGQLECLRFLMEMRPQRLIERTIEVLATKQFSTYEEVPIKHIVESGMQTVVVMATEAHTFVAEGFGAHNSVMYVGGLDDGGRIWILDRFKGRPSVPELAREMERLWEFWEPFAIWVEDSASGTPAVQTLMEANPRVPTEVVSYKGGKSSRAHALSAYIHGGHVVFPRNAEWLNDCAHELTHFGYTGHDDDLDALYVLVENLLKQTHPSFYAQSRDARLHMA